MLNLAWKFIFFRNIFESSGITHMHIANLPDVRLINSIRNERFLYEIVNPLMHNVPKWSDTFLKFRSKRCNFLKVCLTILRRYALKG